MKKFLLPITCLLLTVSCATIPQNAALNTDLSNIQKTNIGKGKSLYVEVNDNRSSDKVGNRGNSLFTAAITLDDVETPMQSALEQAFAKKGYEISSNPDVSRKIIADVNFINFEMNMGLVTGDFVARSAAKVRAGKGDLDFSKTFKSKSQKESMVVLTAAGNQELIDSSVTKLIEDISSDKSLNRALR